MGFSFSMLGENGEDLLEKYGIDNQGIGLFGLDGHYEYKCSREFKKILPREDFGRKYSVHVFRLVKDIVQKNLSTLKSPKHSELCSGCTCKRKIPVGFDVEMAERLVSIPEEEIYSLWGGY